ncbi:elongation of very long chain fatty acids protein AAEL008004 [Ixodes scapularis]|uniref:elongation of very long chain fatty acids protein AAEL008004 n=1 Tax=Ixodes scapularis TaxID=6945 RepID=UPI001125334A|nr:elongation of very long chain fatty acids protein AAEL008004 [Ixodes scapularis]
MAAAESPQLRQSWFPHRDSRTSGWLLTGNPIPVAVITIAYVYFVKVAGPRWMRYRKPFDLRRWILVYNFLTATLSLFFLTLFGKYAYWDNGYGVLQDVDYGGLPSSNKIVHLSWWFYMFRLSELADTVFFVLRKKSNQVSTLHVFHHVVVSWNMWLSVTYGGQAHAMFITCMNSFVHVIMYTYYFLAALGPAYKEYLWWKRYLTMLQIVQFSLLLLHCLGTALAKGNYVPLFIWLSISQSLVFFVWFVMFYIRAYKIRCRITPPEPSKSD